MAQKDAEIRIYDRDLMAELESEDGQKVQIALVAELDYKGHTYVAYHPADIEHDYSDVLEMVVDNDGTVTYLTIEDDDLHREVFEVFSEKFDEVFWGGEDE